MVAARMKGRDAATQGEVLVPVNASCPSGQIGLSMITNASRYGPFWSFFQAHRSFDRRKRWGTALFGYRRRCSLLGLDVALMLRYRSDP